MGGLGGARERKIPRKGLVWPQRQQDDGAQAERDLEASSQTLPLGWRHGGWVSARRPASRSRGAKEDEGRQSFLVVGGGWVSGQQRGTRLRETSAQLCGDRRRPEPSSCLASWTHRVRTKGRGCHGIILQSERAKPELRSHPGGPDSERSVPAAYPRVPWGPGSFPGCCCIFWEQVSPVDKEIIALRSLSTPEISTSPWG